MARALRVTLTLRSRSQAVRPRMLSGLRLLTRSAAFAVRRAPQPSRASRVCMSAAADASSKRKARRAACAPRGRAMQRAGQRCHAVRRKT
jgi:hypothetical protein